MADGPGGKEVGRVYVRVLPNTAEFAARLKAAIKGMNDKVEVDVDVNTKEAKAKIEALARSKNKITLITEADTARAEAQVEKLARDKQISIQARALTEKAAADLERLTERRRNLNIRVSAITSQAAAQLAALDRKREVLIEAHLSDQSIAKAEARIQALDRRRELILTLNDSQVTKRYNRLKAQMRHLTSQLDIQTNPASLARIRAQLEEVSRGFRVMGDIKLKGREEALATVEALKRRYQLVIEARSGQVDKALAKVEAEMDAIRDKRRIELQAVFDGATAKGEFEAWKRSFLDQVSKVALHLNTAQATVDWEAYKALLERSKVELNADLNTARASVQGEELKRQIESLRVSINAMLDPKSRENVRAQIAIMARDYKLHLNAVLEDAGARVSIENLVKGRDVYFHAVLDTKKAMVQFAALERDRIAELHIQLRDNLKAQAEMTALGQDRTVEYKALIKGERKLTTELAWLTRDRTVNVHLRADLKTALFRKFNGELKRSEGILGSFKTTAEGIFRLVGGGLAQAFGKLTTMVGGAGEGMTEVGKAMTGSVTNSMGSFVSAAVTAGLTMAGLLAIGGALLALFAGLAATILSVAAALLGMVAAVAMLAAALVGAFIGVAALAAIPIALTAGAALLLAKGKELNKEFNKLSMTFKEVMTKAARPMIKEFQKELPKLRGWLRSMEPEFRGAFAAASKHLESFRLAIQNFVQGILPGLTKGMNAKPFENFMKAFSKAFGVIGKSIGDTFNILAQNGDKFAVVVGEIARGLGEVLPALARFLAATATGAKATGQIADGIAQMFDNLASSFNNALASDGWESTVKGISDMFALLGESIGKGFEVAMQNGDSFGKAFRAIGDTFVAISEPLANFTASGAEQFAAVMPSMDEGLKKIIPSMQSFTEAFAKFAPGVVTSFSDALAELFTYLSTPAVAQQCAEITKALIELLKVVLGPETLNAMLSMADIALDIANMLSPIIPLLMQFFILSVGFKTAGAMVGFFGRDLMKVKSVLTAASGESGRFGKVMTSLGGRLKSFGSVVKGGLIKSLTRVGTTAAKIGPRLATVGKGFGTAVATFGRGAATMMATMAKVLARTVVFALRMAAQWIIAMGPIGWIAIAVAALVALIIIYWDEICAAAKVAWDWIYSNVVKPVIDLIMAIFQPFIDWIKENWSTITAVAQVVWDAIWGVISAFIENVKLIFFAFITALTTPWMLIWTAVQIAWAMIWAEIQTVIAIIVAAFQIFIGTIVNAWNYIVAQATNAWNLIVGIVSGVIDIIMGIIDIFVGLVTGDWDRVQAGASRVWKGIQGIVSSVISFIRGLISNVAGFITSQWETVSSAATGAWNRISGAFSGAMDSIRSACSSAIGWIVGKFNGLKDKVSGALSKMNPANWFSASLDVGVNTPSLGAMSVPLTLSAPAATTFAALSKDNPWRQDAQTLASGIQKADTAFNTSLAVAAGLNSDSSGTTAPAARVGNGVTVNVETNANPFQIGKEVAWALRRK